MYVLSFDDLLRFMNYVKVSVQTSPYYAEFPESLNDLLLRRRTPSDAEVTHLALIPMVPEYFRVDQRDIPLIM